MVTLTEAGRVFLSLVAVIFRFALPVPLAQIVPMFLGQVERAHLLLASMVSDVRIGETKMRKR